MLLLSHSPTPFPWVVHVGCVLTTDFRSARTKLQFVFVVCCLLSVLVLLLNVFVVCCLKFSLFVACLTFCLLLNVLFVACLTFCLLLNVLFVACLTVFFFFFFFFLLLA